ncbi:MAG TPA: pyridoxamine 5'-phosphate oxidase family protein [Phototrophicaceae bacterium]|nr:pyridoxamine 5'-phosphate oxidase family protein [Phototrophicaceae bacterium]
MLTDEMRAFLQKPLVARMSTMDANGYPHTVPVWYMLDNDDIVIISIRQTAKIGHLKTSPKGAVAIGGDPNDGGGYLIKGEFTIEEDPDDFWMKKLTYHYESGAQAEKDIADWTPLDIVLLRLKIKSIAKVA